MSYDDDTYRNHEDPLDLYLDFHHHSILISSEEESLIAKLKDEFHHFVSAPTENPGTSITLSRGAAPEIPKLVAHKILEQAIVYKLGPLKYVDYFGNALAIWNEDEQKLTLYSMDSDRLFELAFLGVHSFLGQRLDEKGFSRVHALGVSYQQVNLLVMLPSKGGKSTLLSHLLENPNVKIISDDTPLIGRDGSVHPFPTKMSLSEKPVTGPLKDLTWHEFKRTIFPPKWTASLAQFPSRIERESVARKTLLVAGFRVSQGESLLVPVKRHQMVKPLLEHMVIGIGLPQVVEFFLNFSVMDLWKMAKHFCLRSLCAVRLILNSECYYFYMGKDSEYNSQMLLEIADEHGNS